jgi:hypothetical protein
VRARGIAALVIASTLSLEAAPALAQRLSLRAQAHALYAPVSAFERSFTRADRTRVKSAENKDSRRIETCEVPYLHRLKLSNKPGAIKLESLYFDGSGMEGSQSRIAPIASQLATLAGAWSRIRLSNRAMNDFAHGLAAEFDASLNMPRFDACAFIRAIARHHYSYSWARRSAAGKLAKHYETRLIRASERADRFWIFTGQTGLPGSSSAPGAKLFSRHQLIVLANLPGEQD